MNPAQTVTEALTSRLSVRDFLPTPVPGELIRQVLTTASRSPSGGNVQPWHIDVVAGERLDALKAIVAQKVAATMSDSADSPVLDPYSQGSMTLLLTSSSSTMRPIVHSTRSQPGSTAKARVSGNAAAMNGPR